MRSCHTPPTNSLTRADDIAMSLSAPPSLLGRGPTDPPTINGGHSSNDEDSIEGSTDGKSDDNDMSDEEINASVRAYSVLRRTTVIGCFSNYGCGHQRVGVVTKGWY